MIAPCGITVPSQREQVWRLAKMYCFISKEIIFEQNSVTNGEPVKFVLPPFWWLS